ncbi:MAG: sugar phosphate isomerase/epimerase [Planctomycetota bacterium]
MLDRRTLMKVSVALAATQGSILRGSSPNQGCYLGFSTYGCKTWTTEEAIRRLSAIGFDAVEIIVRKGWDADSAKLSESRRKQLATQIADSPLTLTSLMEHVYPTSDVEQRVALERLKLACELAHDLAEQQAPVVQTVLGGGVFSKKKRELRDRLGAWAELAEKTQTTIAIKPHRGGVVSKPEEAVWLFEQLGNPTRLRMVYDYSHYAFRGMSIEETVETSLPYTVHVAVKDAVEEAGRVVFKLPGSAETIDFAKILSGLNQGGYSGDINCEVSGMVWSKTGYDPLAAAKKCYDVVAAVFEETGIGRRRKTT